MFTSWHGARIDPQVSVARHSLAWVADRNDRAARKAAILYPSVFVSKGRHKSQGHYNVMCRVAATTEPARACRPSVVQEADHTA